MTIFLGYQNTMHNIQNSDVHTDTIKTTKYFSKNEIQYGDDVDNRSPASAHLMEEFIGSSDFMINTEPKKIILEL